MIRSKFLFAGLGLISLPVLHVEARQKPNVVFILADDLGYGDLSCFGQEKFQTPNIDRLALNGMRCTHTYAGSTVSAPSRACLLTGLHGGHAPIRGNKELEPEGQFPLPAGAYTLFHLFKMPAIRRAPSANGDWGNPALREIQPGRVWTNFLGTIVSFLHIIIIPIIFGITGPEWNYRKTPMGISVPIPRI